MYSLTSASPRQADPPPVRTQIPFAAIPHHIADDPRVTPTDLALLRALTFYARSKATCWPADHTLAARMRCSEATVQRRLKHLSEIGVIRRERVAYTPQNPTGRLLVLIWMEGGPSSAREGGPSSVRDKGTVSFKKNEEIRTGSRDTTRPETPRPVALREPPRTPQADAGLFGRPPAVLRTSTPEPSQAPPAPLSGPEAATRRPSWVETAARCRAEMAEKAADDPILAKELARKAAPRPEAPPPPPEDAPTAELIARVRECPAVAARLISRLTVDLKDAKSYQCYRAVVDRVWRGELPAEILGHAYAKAMGPTARNPGAIFMVEIKRGLAG